MNFSDLCRFTPKQWEATQAADSHRYCLIGGKRGVLKSYTLRWYFVRRHLMWAADLKDSSGRLIRPGIRDVATTLLCESMPALIDRQVTKIQEEFPSWLGEVKTTRLRGFGFHFRPEYGNGIIRFRSLDDQKRVRGVESAGFGVDELTQNQEMLYRNMSLFDVLRGSLRWPGLDDPFFLSASNPDGPGQIWVRKLFVERDLSVELEPERDQFFYLKGEAEKEAKHLLPQSYWDMLNTLSPLLKKAWVDGDWYVNFSGVVYSEFGADNIIHDFTPDKSKPIELAFDDGFVDPRAILFIQNTGREIVVFDEHYKSRQQDDDCVREILEMCRSYGFELPEIAVGSSEAAQFMGRLRKADVTARGGTHEVVDGIKHVRRQIVDANGVRSLKVVAFRCPNFISELTSGYRYPSKPKSDNEKPADGNDHACDAFRYWAWMRVSHLE